MSQTRTGKVAALSLGKVLTAGVSLATGMVMARVLSEVELATYRQTLLAYQVLIPLLSLGLGQGLYYFLPTEKTRVRGVVADALVMMLGLGLLYAVFIALGGNHLLARRFSNPAIVETLAYLVPLPLVMLPVALMESVLVVRNQVGKLAGYNVWTHLVLAVGIIGACLIWRSPESMVLARVGIGVTTGLAGLRLMLVALPRDDWRPQWGRMKAMVAYSLPLVSATAIGTIFLQLDKIIVSAMCTPEAFAVYSNGAMEIPLITILTGSIAAVIQPDLRRHVAEGRAGAALALTRQAAEKSAALLLPAMWFLLVSAEPFILTLFSDKYAGSVLPFRMYLLILPVRIAFFAPMMQALGLNKVMFYRSVAGLAVNLVLSVVLVRWMGYLGAIVGTIATLYGVNGVWNFTVISRGAGCRWTEVLPFRELWRIFGASALAAVPVWAIRPWTAGLPPVAELVLHAGLYAAGLAALAWMMGVRALQEAWRQGWRKLAVLAPGRVGWRSKP